MQGAFASGLLPLSYTTTGDASGCHFGVCSIVEAMRTRRVSDVRHLANALLIDTGSVLVTLVGVNRGSQWPVRPKLAMASAAGRWILPLNE